MGPYDYEWEYLGSPIGGNSPNLTDIPKGTYYVTVTDNFYPRTAETSVQIKEPSQDLSAFISGTNLDCYQDNTGVADVTVFSDVQEKCGQILFRDGWLTVEGKIQKRGPKAVSIIAQNLYPFNI